MMQMHSNLSRCPPSKLRGSSVPVALHYAPFETALGSMLLAATDRGICFLQFGDAGALVASLHREFPNAKQMPVDVNTEPNIAAWVPAIQRYADGTDLTCVLPMDLCATAFQRRVWTYLQTIPAGQSRSYTEVAVDLGIPSAVRAVASACARNRIALLVPCHRVLRADGTLAGYRWGLDRKQEILHMEAELAEVSGPGKVLRGTQGIMRD